MIDVPTMGALLFACAAACVTPAAGPDAAARQSNAQASEKKMSSDEITIAATTQPELSGHLVGVGNIFERDLPDDKGVVAPRMSATLAITSRASHQTRHEDVFAGSVIALGADRYAVVAVVEGKKGQRGSITLRRLPPGN
jgi:hypothetical protein